MISSVLKETSKADNANPALSRKVELLLMILDEARAIGDKVLVFSQSLLTLDYLENLFKEQRRTVCRLDGSTAAFKRQEQIKAFNTGKQEIYLISTGAGGVGLNIYGANRVVIFDFKWNPVTEQQAVGRAYRFGQEKTVYVYQFVVSGAFEEALQNKTVFKMQLASRVVDKKKPVSWGKRVGELLQPIKPKPAKDLGVLKGRDRILDKLIEHAQPGGTIREIISTDTFEEEDPTNELTAEERKDAQELHDLERMRHTNPEKYRMMLDQKQRAEQIRAMAEAARPSRVDMAAVNARLMEDLYIPQLSPSSGLAHDDTAASNINTMPVTQTQADGVMPLGPQVSDARSFITKSP
jgi:SNF2 family DNA or RNA helicase